jgi:hypothetical protein
MSEMDQHDLLTQRMDRIEASVAENTRITQGIKADTAEFLEVFTAVRGGLKVLGWLGSVLKWGAGVGAALIGLYYAIKGGSGAGPHP